MKRIVKCLICGKYTPYYRSYQVRVAENVAVAVGRVVQTESIERICRKCVEKMGYKVRKK